MKRFCFLSLLAVGLILVGCDSRPVSQNPVPEDYAFDILIPATQSHTADYYAESGIAVRTQKELHGDSEVVSTRSSFSAQFRTAPGIALPSSVTLNDNVLLRNHGSDTLRLSSISGNDIYKANVWGLLQSSGDSEKFSVPAVEKLDSVVPFTLRTNIRNDTSLTLKWKPPGAGSSGLNITIIVPGREVYSTNVDESFGTYQIPASAMMKLQGDGKIYLTRYLAIERPYRGKTLLLYRVVQRIYEIKVQ